MFKTTLAHHPSCPREQMWDIEGVSCDCPRFWPHKVCTTCWMPPKRHRKDCPERPQVSDAVRLSR